MTDAVTCDEPVEYPTVRPDPLRPPTAFSELREDAPICPLRYPGGGVGWLVASHELARAVLTDQRFTSQASKHLSVDWDAMVEYMAGSAPPDAIRRYLDTSLSREERLAAHREIFPKYRGNMLAQDNERHTWLRKMHTGYFSVRAVSGWTSMLERIVGECLDGMERAGSPVDLLEVYARPVASMMTCEVLGLPYEDRARFMEPISASMSDEAVTSDDDPGMSARADAMSELREYVRGVVERKRAQPGDDLLSEIVANGDLDDDEMIGVADLLFIAAYETSTAQISLSVFALLSDPTLWQTLQQDPSLIPGAVEELVRYMSIVQPGATRDALEDVELGGVTIKPGETVTVSLLAANHDPAKFTDPARIDLRRDTTGHLGFGQGRHMCIGQHLARLELQIALRGLIERFPNLHLAVPADKVSLPTRPDHTFRLDGLPVAW
jgi:cytochrome P450